MAVGLCDRGCWAADACLRTAQKKNLGLIGFDNRDSNFGNA